MDRPVAGIADPPAAAAGEQGALRALEILRDELVRTMQLCGVHPVGEIGPDLPVPGAADR
jgi:(S)-mandelate dehydrogenase